MKIIKAKQKDLNIIADIFKNAIDLMNNNNLYQWDEIYPNHSILERDLLKEQMFIGIDNNIIVSVVVVNNEFDEQYKNGNWKYNNSKFTIIHRLCVNPKYQNQKIGKNTMILVEKLLKKQGIQSIRLDVFSLNTYALRMYQTLQYQKVGEANFRKGLFYLLEKRL